MPVKTAVIIPNFNGKKILKKCLDTLREQSFKDFRTYVVDNGSVDGSAAMVKRLYPEVKLVELKENTGFARGSNVGIRAAIKDNGSALKYICPLNNDIELDGSYLEHLVGAADEYEKKKIKFGVLAAKLMFSGDRDIINTVGTLIKRDGSGMEKGFRDPEQGQFDKPEEIFGGCGAAVLYLKEMLDAISYKNKKGEDCYFDEDFFAYYEDLDLNYRSRLRGYKAFFVPYALGYHLHSATCKSYSPFKSFHVHRNQYYVLLKNFPWPYLLMGLLLMPFRYVLLVISVLTGKGPSAHLKKNSKKKSVSGIVLSGWWDIIKSLPWLLKRRRQIQKNRSVSLGEFGRWLKIYKASYRKMIFS